MGDAISTPDMFMSIIVPYILPYLIPVAAAIILYVSAHLPAVKQAKMLDEYDYLKGLTETVVQAVEQTSRLSSGSAKRAQAENALKQFLGTSTLPSQVGAMIEAAVLQLPHSAVSGSAPVAPLPQDVSAAKGVTQPLAVQK